MDLRFFSVLFSPQPSSSFSRYGLNLRRVRTVSIKVEHWDGTMMLYYWTWTEPDSIASLCSHVAYNFQFRSNRTWFRSESFHFSWHWKVDQETYGGIKNPPTRTCSWIGIQFHPFALVFFKFFIEYQLEIISFTSIFKKTTKSTAFGVDSGTLSRFLLNRWNEIVKFQSGGVVPRN